MYILGFDEKDKETLNKDEIEPIALSIVDTDAFIMLE